MTETTCDTCGLTYYYSPANHECRDPAEVARDRAALLARTGRYSETWADECVRKVMAR